MIKYISNIDYSNQDYSKILTYFLTCNVDEFEFVIRSDIDFKGDFSYTYNNTAYELIKEISPYLIETKVSNNWISGNTFESPARIYHVEFNSKSLSIILKHTNKFSDWQGPSYPEDLSLIKRGESILSIIGHESLSKWNLIDNQYTHLNTILTSFELDLE